MALPGLMLAATSPSLWQPPSLGMLTMPSENWCARCKTSFRMTSDLVYHMRTYHKRENLTTGGSGTVDEAAVSSGGNVTEKDDKQDGDKTGDEKTLRCKVCKETFRERHHLTRHMTSHVR
ncbi:zinc finger protein 488-like [Lytechinus variegatus]|uniref:zinc finger protein 488-like n=1 Tax=Lytechinus variegatus TaxID=7654 RepID=UPI001BB1F818|nr:zinc finger protein 488-like [Lytechinus variegatus]